VLALPTPGPPLPDIQPGALPRLKSLELLLYNLQTTLPPSWGASPSVLPALQTLMVVAKLRGPLPAAWGSGFRHLTSLGLYDMQHDADVDDADLAGGGDVEADVAAGTEADVSPRRLPPQWAAPGRFPALTCLDLGGTRLQGPLPPAWGEKGGLPALVTL